MFFVLFMVLIPPFEVWGLHRLTYQLKKNVLCVGKCTYLRVMFRHTHMDKICARHPIWSEGIHHQYDDVGV